MKTQTEKHTIEFATTISLGDCSSIRVGHSIQRNIEFDSVAERNRQLAALRIEVAQECGHQLVAALKPTEDDLRRAVKALVPAQQQLVILKNPAAVYLLRLVTGQYPAGVRTLEELEARGTGTLDKLRNHTFPDEAHMPDDYVGSLTFDLDM